MKDMGKFVGWSFYLVAFLQIVASIYSLLTTQEIKLDFSIMVTIIIGYFLIQHNNKARKLVLLLSIISIIIFSSLIIIFTITGINEIFHIYIFNNSIEVNNLKDLYFWAISAIILGLIPFLLLKSKKAIEEFESKEVSV